MPNPFQTISISTNPINHELSFGRFYDNTKKLPRVDKNKIDIITNLIRLEEKVNSPLVYSLSSCDLHDYKYDIEKALASLKKSLDTLLNE